MIQISNIKIRKDISDTKLFETIIKKYKIEPKDVVEWHISRKSIDARKKDDIHYIYSIDLKLKNENKYKKFNKVKEFNIPKIKAKNTDKKNVVIVGAGPSGLHLFKMVFLLLLLNKENLLKTERFLLINF